MELNVNAFNGSTNISLSEAGLGLSPYVTYLTILLLFLGAAIVTLPALFIIIIIFKNEKLQTKNNIFLINLLISDIIQVLSRLTIRGALIIMYLCGLNASVNCVIVQSFNLTTGVATKISFLPVIVDRLLYIALPFAYKRIVTNKVVAMTIIIIWIVTVCVSVDTVINQPLLYQPAIGDCLLVTAQIQAFPIVLCITIVVVIITSIYFRYKIYKSNKFFNSVHTTAEQRQKAISAGKLLEKLHKELSSTVSILIVGGIDGLLNLL